MTTISCRTSVRAAAALAGALAVSAPALAADWSDTAISWRHGSKFAEPFNPKDISKNIFALTHASGYKYGSNFFNVDFLMSDSNDPSTVGGSGAQEAYVVYRNTLEYSKISGKKYSVGPLRDVGLTFGFDWNTKNDVGYASKKRMLVLGPTVMFDVPGFLNVSLLMLDESNAPVGHPSRYSYKMHPMLSGVWGIPLGKSGFSFEGYANLIASKGKDEFGAQTKMETLVDAQVMYDVGAAFGGPARKFKVGLEYQYWKNKFGNDASGPAGTGAFAKTPMIRAEYHF